MKRILLVAMLALSGFAQAMPVVEPTEVPEWVNDDSVREIMSGAMDGDARNQALLGWLYRKGWSVEQDKTKGAYWYEKAAEQGHVGAQSSLGRLYFSGEGVQEDLSKAAYWYLKAAKQGDAGSQHVIGLMYAHGMGLKEDKTKALMWMKKADAQGYEEAKYDLFKLEN